MDAAAAAPFVVLKSSMAVDGLDVRPPGKERVTVTPAKDWPSIAISRKKTYGCGEHGQNLVQGLTLYLQHSGDADAYPAGDLTSSLSIGLSDEARRSIEAELGVATPGSLPPGVVRAEASVKTVTEQLLVILLSFEIWEHSDRVYYLVYDSTDASLYMIPTLPLALKPSYWLAPVPRFTGGGAGRDHELVLLARKRQLQPDNNTHVCVCTPETRTNANAAEPAGVWRVRTRRMPELPYAFAVDEAFAFQGRLFWADLAQGLVHCNALRVGDAAAAAAVEFGFISLPRGYLVADKETVQETLERERTISCVGGAIQFVCIDRHTPNPGGHTVNVWTLDMDRRRWEEHEGFPCLWKEMWRRQQAAGFMDAEAARDVVPRYPVLMPGGALCLLLSNMPRKRKDGYICSFDMRNKRLLWSGTVRDYGGNFKSFILPRSFFTKCYGPSREEVLTTRNRKRPREARCSDRSCRRSGRDWN